MTGLGNSILSKSEALVSRLAFSRQEHGVLYHTAFECAGGNVLQQWMYTEAIKMPKRRSLR